MMNGRIGGQASLFILCACLTVLLVAACSPSQPTPTAQAPKPEANNTEAPAAEEKPEPTATPVPPTAPPTEAPPDAPPTEAPTAEPREPALLPEPQQISFAAGDGQELEGTYYPAAANPAPIIVLMHWAPGDQSSWVEIALWLQNQGLGGQTKSSDTWLDPSWFPALPNDASYAVFTFTFRECGGGAGCQSFEPDGWLLDAWAAMETAGGLEGVNPERMVAIGASIGSAGATDTCADGCLGALALSPGSYLNIPFAEAVTALDAGVPPRPVWCLAAEGDGESAPTCRSASGDSYRAIAYPGSHHGMQLIRPGLDPDTMGIILEFLGITLGG